jgi:hypothetical protein
MGILSLHAGHLVFTVMYDAAGLNASLVHAGMGILVPVRSRPIQEGFSNSTTNLRIPRLMQGKSLYPWVRYKSQSEKQRNVQCSGGVPEARESSPEDKERCGNE